MLLSADECGGDRKGGDGSTLPRCVLFVFLYFSILFFFVFFLFRSFSAVMRFRVADHLTGPNGSYVFIATYQVPLAREIALFATFRVARLTLQTPKNWLVGVATDRDARHACLRFFSFSCFFFCQHNTNQKMKIKTWKTQNIFLKNSGASKGRSTSRDGSKTFFFLENV